MEEIWAWVGENAAALGVVFVVIAGAWALYKHFTQKESQPKTVQKNTVGDNNSGTVNQAGGDINIGYSIEQHEDALNARLHELRADLERTHGAEKALLQSQMANVEQGLANRDASYQEALKTIKELESKLSNISSDDASKERIDRARMALAQGSFVLAKELFEAIAAKEKSAVKRAAEAQFSLGQIAAQEIRWQDATQHFERASQLEPSIEYLFAASYFLGKIAKYKKAENLARTALEKAIALHGEDHPDTAASYNNLASNLDDQGRYDEAAPLYQKALDICRCLLGEDHPNTAASYNNLASNLDAQGKYDEAEPLYQKSLEITLHALGEEHPDTAMNYNNLAYNLDAQGEYDEAEPLHQKALDIRRLLLGEEHPDTAMSYNNLAYNLRAQGQYAEAESLHRKALDIYLRLLGEDHPDTAMSYNNLAYNLDAQGEYDEAAPLFRKALEINLRALGAEHPQTRLSQQNYEAFLASRRQ